MPVTMLRAPLPTMTVRSRVLTRISRRMAPRRPKHSGGSSRPATTSPRRGGSSRSRAPAGPLPDIDGDAVLRALATIPGGGTTAQVARLLGLSGDGARALGSHFRELVTQGKVLETRPGRYQPSGAGGEHAAVLEASENGGGMVARLPEGDPVPVDARMTIGARIGDVCQVMISEDNKALVTRILRRAGRVVVGLINIRPSGKVFVPDNRREGELPVLATTSAFDNAYRAGDRVRGTLTIGADGQAGVIIDGVLAANTPEVTDFTYTSLVHDLPGPFPEEVEREAAAFPAKLPLGQREDLSEKLIFTIDPETAKDFDDAISLEPRPGGGWNLGVHIADVSHYVREGTALDAEAAARATSIYLINRVIPMLPEVLSNGLCSLVPNQNRFALSVFMELDKQLKLVGTRLSETVIHSRQRLTYEQALDIIEGKDGQWPTDLIEVVRQVGTIAQGLRRAREKAGALNLYSVEYRFVLDAEGNPEMVRQESTDASHQLIEECMLLANRAVATWLEQQGFPVTYRIHAQPDPDRTEQFASILEAYGIDAAGVQDRFGLQRILKRLEQEPHSARLVLNFMCLRSFKKAVYAVENIGHYALAFERYCHFTSPIRRYPDLLVHRLVKRVLKLKDYTDVEIRREYLDALCRQSSGLEQRAEQAERTLHARKCARYLAARLGEGFPAVVTGANGGGLYVQLLETGMEGFLPMRDLGDEYWNYVPERFSLVGSRSGRVLGPGVEVDIILNNVDIERSEVTFGLDRFLPPPSTVVKNAAADADGEADANGAAKPATDRRVRSASAAPAKPRGGESISADLARLGPARPAKATTPKKGKMTKSVRAPKGGEGAKDAGKRSSGKRRR